MFSVFLTGATPTLQRGKGRGRRVGGGALLGSPSVDQSVGNVGEELILEIVSLLALKVTLFLQKTATPLSLPNSKEFSFKAHYS